jgi:predicted RNA-binding Zn-ribbon protein involved in translation (DUF1610 family)
MEMMKRDTSTKEGVQEGATIFMCPNCGDEEIVRSLYAKRLGIRYTCTKCSFSGPN